MHIWKPEEISLLGTLTDREVAEKLGIAKQSCTQKRYLLGIPPVELGDRKEKILVARAQKLSDEELSKRVSHPFTGRYSKIVMKERKRRGLKTHASKSHKKYRHGTESLKAYLVKEALKLVPTPTLDELGQVFNVTRERIRQLGNV